MTRWAGGALAALLWCSLACPRAAAAQDPGAAASPSGDVPVNLPAFDYTASVVSPGGGGILRAEETGSFRIELRNLEVRAHKQVKISFLALSPLEGLPTSGSLVVPELLPGERRSIELPVAAGRGVPNGSADYVIEVAAEDGAYGPPTRIAIQTRAFVPPRFEILAVEHRRAGARLRLKATFQNIGGPAREVVARFVPGDPAVSLLSTASMAIGDLANGEQAEVVAEAELGSPGRDQPEVPIWLEISEHHADLVVRERFSVSLRENEGLTKIATPSPL